MSRPRAYLSSVATRFLDSLRDASWRAHHLGATSFGFVDRFNPRTRRPIKLKKMGRNWRAESGSDISGTRTEWTYS